MKPLAAYRLVKIRTPAKPRGALDLRRQSLAALAPAGTQNALSTARAHPAQETVNAPAISLLGLIGALDRASVQEPKLAASDSGSITSSRAQDALRYPQAGVIFRAREQAGKRTSLKSSTKPTTESN
jgi:hypothetical protein